MSSVWIGLGSNLGPRAQLLAHAVDALAAADLPAARLSHLYETTPEYGADEPPYLNVVLQTESDRDPGALLAICTRIEEELGRVRVGAVGRAGPRPIDLDLLSVGDLVLDLATPGGPLVLPHPRLHRRAFVLVPLCELDPHWRHPEIGRTAAELLAALVVPTGSVQLWGALGREVVGAGPYPWRHLPARGGNPA